ncbi:remorin 4.1-like [Zingiber officinale]|uniref:Remorin C-terminal domain-containing protein n=1 Tax=Zingiber officinale TaxID=94328 RepID=A0A8J5GEL3_ZINOF|nr:remorin 4.1-like [Zingiber officinale]KAG6504871.1 hypothetical protein ZIOFF_037219 [Zingiber officinale]
MWNDRSVTRAEHGEGEDIPELRDIHPLTPRSLASRGRRRDPWDGAGSLSVRTNVSLIDSTMTRELSAMVVSGSNAQQNGSGHYGNESNDRGEDVLGEEVAEVSTETNPLAIVPTDPIASPGLTSPPGAGDDEGAGEVGLPPVHVVRREEVESKVAAWQTAEVAKVNNRYKREEVIINGWESEQVEKATAWLKRVERKLEKQRARAMEKMQNDIAKAQQKAAEKKASAEAKRGTKVARVLELANFMRAVGRAPSKRSFF